MLPLQWSKRSWIIILMKDEKKYYLGFSAFLGIGPKKFFLLKDYFGSVKKAYLASSFDLLKAGLNQNLVNPFVKFRENLDLDSYFLRLRENGIECQTLEDKNYPENLKNIDNPPFILFSKGKLMVKDKFSLAVVGSRRMSEYGKLVTQKIVKDLVGYNLTIVSGLAYGVDTVAHKTTLRNHGRTIAVLPCSLDEVYPKENEGLVKEIIKRGGAVISEYPPGFRVFRGNFPARNRIISGISLGTLVTEGAERSGSLITARLAGEQGREVFAVPGPVTSKNSFTPSLLIKMGAKLVWDVNDILEELNLKKR